MRFGAPNNTNNINMSQLNAPSASNVGQQPAPNNNDDMEPLRNQISTLLSTPLTHATVTAIDLLLLGAINKSNSTPHDGTPPEGHPAVTIGLAALPKGMHGFKEHKLVNDRVYGMYQSLDDAVFDLESENPKEFVPDASGTAKFERPKNFSLQTPFSCEAYTEVCSIENESEWHVGANASISAVPAINVLGGGQLDHTEKSASQEYKLSIYIMNTIYALEPVLTRAILAPGFTHAVGQLPDSSESADYPKYVDFLKRYGAFYAKQLRMGCRAILNGSFKLKKESSSTNAKATASATLGIVAANVGGTFDTASTSSIEALSVSCGYYGGEYTGLPLSLSKEEVKGTSTSQKEAWQKWLASGIKNPVLIGIEVDHIHKLVELVDPLKAAQLERFFPRTCYITFTYEQEKYYLTHHSSKHNPHWHFEKPIQGAHPDLVFQIYELETSKLIALRHLSTGLYLCAPYDKAQEGPLDAVTNRSLKEVKLKQKRMKNNKNRRKFLTWTYKKGTNKACYLTFDKDVHVGHSYHHLIASTDNERNIFEIVELD